MSRLFTTLSSSVIIFSYQLVISEFLIKAQTECDKLIEVELRHFNLFSDTDEIHPPEHDDSLSKQTLLIRRTLNVLMICS